MMNGARYQNAAAFGIAGFALLLTTSGALSPPRDIPKATRSSGRWQFSPATSPSDASGSRSQGRQAGLRLISVTPRPYQFVPAAPRRKPTKTLKNFSAVEALCLTFAATTNFQEPGHRNLLQGHTTRLRRRWSAQN
jgi:hypothetical protein